VLKLLLYSIVVSVESYFIIMGMFFFIFGTLAQVGAYPKEKEKPPRKPLDVLLLGHHLKRLARSFKSSQRPNPYQVRVHLGLQDQHAVKWMPRTHLDSFFLMIHI